MSTTVKPKVTTSSDNGGMDSWKKLERTTSQSMRQDRIEQGKDSQKSANISQDKICRICNEARINPRASARINEDGGEAC
jgi:hypothetical protein